MEIEKVGLFAATVGLDPANEFIAPSFPTKRAVYRFLVTSDFGGKLHPNHVELNIFCGIGSAKMTNDKPDVGPVVLDFEP